MSAPSDTTHASKARDDWTISFLLYIWNIFQEKLSIFRTFEIELSEQNPTNSVA